VELAELIGFELDDPRLAAVDVTGVRVSPDSRYATVKVAIRGDERGQRQSLAALEHASGFLRRELARRLELRCVPDLRFEQDLHPEAASRVDLLLKRARKSRARRD